MTAATKLGRLVIARKPGERVRVGDVIIEVDRIRYGEVRLAITAPIDTPIVRCELEQEQ